MVDPPWKSSRMDSSGNPSTIRAKTLSVVSVESVLNKTGAINLRYLFLKTLIDDLSI